jgi:hypothetical protein
MRATGGTPGEDGESGANAFAGGGANVADVAFDSRIKSAGLFQNGALHVLQICPHQVKGEDGVAGVDDG